MKIEEIIEGLKPCAGVAKTCGLAKTHVIVRADALEAAMKILYKAKKLMDEVRAERNRMV